MTQQILNINPPGGGTGDTLNVGGGKINSNFTELYRSRSVTVYADDYCVGDGVTDDTANVNAATAAAGTGGIVQFDPNKKYYIASSITVPDNVYLVGNVSPGDLLPTWNFTNVTPQLILGTTATVNIVNSGICGFAVVRKGVSLNPATAQSTIANVAAYTGTGITVGGSGSIIRDCVVVGHTLGIFCTLASRFHIKNVIGDCTSGLLIDNMHDISDIEGVTFTGQVGPASGGQFTNIAITGAANNGSGVIRLAVASTSALLTGNKIWVTGIVGTTEANNTWTINVIDLTHVDLVGSTFTNAYVSGGTLILDVTFRSGIAFEVTNSENPRFVNCFGFGHQTTWHFGVLAGWCNCINCGSDGNNGANDPTTTSILVDSTAYGLSWIGGLTSSHGTALSFSSSSTLQSSIVGVSFNSNGSRTPFSVTNGTLTLSGCTGRTQGAFTIGNSVIKLQIDGCNFSTATVSYGGTTAKANTIISGSNFNGTIFEQRALPTADPHVLGQWWANAGIVTISAG